MILLLLFSTFAVSLSYFKLAVLGSFKKGQDTLQMRKYYRCLTRLSPGIKSGLTNQSSGRQTAARFGAAYFERWAS